MPIRNCALASAIAFGAMMYLAIIASAAQQHAHQSGMLTTKSDHEHVHESAETVDDDHSKDKSSAATQDGHTASDHGHSNDDQNTPRHGAHDDHVEESHDAAGKHDLYKRHDHEHDEAVRLSSDQMREFGITAEPVLPGPIAVTITRPAEVTYNMDRFVHVVPRVAGIAVSVNAAQGHVVKAGQELALLESRELAELKAAYLAAIERLELAKENFEREKALREKSITSEKSFLLSRSTYAEARITLRSAKQKLHALGIASSRLDEIAKTPDADLTRFTLLAPMGGIVVERHLVQGEAVPSDREAFIIADVSSVWVNISIYSRDLEKVFAGQRVTIKSETGLTAEGKIEHVTPGVSEQTRTATARVLLRTPSQRFRPGMFVNAAIDIAASQVSARIPKSALQTEDGREVVFVGNEGIFRPRRVKIGQRNEHFAEVLDGLTPGELIATQGSFVIKSQLSKESFGDGHNH
jgi:membrane fusion protein, heavy metal efflux system